MKNTGRVEFTEDDGHELAGHLIRDLQQDYLERGKVLESTPDDMPEAEFSALNDRWWKENKSEVLRRYLAQVAAAGSPALEHGFYAALSDAIGVQATGSYATWETYVAGEASALEGKTGER